MAAGEDELQVAASEDELQVATSEDELQVATSEDEDEELQSQPAAGEDGAEDVYVVPDSEPEEVSYNIKQSPRGSKRRRKARDDGSLGKGSLRRGALGKGGQKRRRKLATSKKPRLQ